MAPQVVLLEQLKALKSKRTQIKAQCTRFRTYLAKLDVPEVSVIELRQRLQIFSENWAIFNEIQENIEGIEVDEDDEEAHQEERTQFETRYFEITCDIETLIQGKVQAEQPAHDPAAQLSQASANKTLNANGGNAVNEGLMIPRLEVPAFSGNYDGWIPFRNIFTSMFHNNKTMTNIKKMQYLMLALKGDAYDVISSFDTSDENYEEAWNTLKERYDDDSATIQKHIRALFEQPAMTKENHVALRKLLDNVMKHLRALKALKRPTDTWDDLMIHLVTSRLDPATSKGWETSTSKDGIPTFSQLTDFLSKRCRALEASSRAQQPAASVSKQGKHDHNKITSAHVATTKVMCAFCGNEDHFIYRCSEFSNLSIDQRIKEAKARKLCLNCLKASSHQAKQCGSGACRKCGKRHNTLLHLEQIPKNNSDATVVAGGSRDNERVVATSVNHSAIAQERQVLLATAIVNILDVKGVPKPCRALLDSGSQSCFITTNCVKSLGLKQIPTHIPILGLGELSTQSRSLAKVTLQSRINGYRAKLDCLVIDRIAQALPGNQLSLEELQVPEGITLADPEFNRSSDIDLLLGAEIFLELLCIGRIKLADDQPMWQKTLLGWIVSGNIMMRDRTTRGTRCNLAIDEHLSENITRFWQLEHNIRQNIRTPEERICERTFANTYKRNDQGRFIVSMPTRDEQLQGLGDSREIAVQRFKALERRLALKPKLKSEYSEFIHEYQNLGHMRELSKGSPAWNARPNFYLPHHCVVKETSTTTRLRVVFDASCKTTSGVSLNDALMVGPVVQQDLFSILLRFRSFEFALTADIAKMYRQVLLDEAQLPLQRIVWRDRPTDELKTYELLTLTYGTAPASFLATQAIRQLADLEENQYPKGALIARRDFYVDDLITGANTREEAEIIRDETMALLERGGFVLRKWASNDEQLLVGISASMTFKNTVDLDKDGTTKTLGVKWNPSKDALQYEIHVDSSREYSKRIILSSIASIFDPLGLLAPVIVTAKIMIQKLWKLQVGWDESLPSDIYTEWSDYVMKIEQLNDFTIQRTVINKGSEMQVELHGFCDASELAYGACVYVRSSNSDGCLGAQLLCAKSRVSPVKTISIPRAELCGALLLTQLMSKVKSALEITISRTYYWTDSSIVLHWIKASNMKLPVFVAHRVGEIQEATAPDEWNHVGTKENPADLVSRGVTPKELMASQLWWNGPRWLQDDTIIACVSPIPEINEGQLREDSASNVVAMLACREPDGLDKYSTLNKLIRVTAMCIRVARICRKEIEHNRAVPLSVDELNYAKRCLIRREQQAAFADELKTLQQKDSVSSRSSAKHMSPFLDENGLIRVGGRLQNSQLERDAKHPILLPHNGKFTELVIEHEHRRLLHAGADATLAAVRLLYWPLRARGTVKRLIHRCITCFKAKPRISEQIMGNLPIELVTPSRPFTSTGVDFCGPIYVREGKRRNSKHVKSYVAVFVCMATKAVHLEVVSDMTTEAFLNAFKRFIGRRGKPRDVFSDNGTNFVGANRELEELRNLFKLEEQRNEIVDRMAVEQIRWHFIPPRAPHFGGLWEAAVKSFKAHFYKVATDAALTFEEASTLVVQIEAILNSRPLTPLSSDPNDFSYLTAGHFLIGSSLVSYPEPDITELKINRLSRWQRIEQIRQHFWKRWSTEYLLQLQRRSKWHANNGAQLETGQLVLCRDDGPPPLKWALGRVQEVCPGSDGIVRTAVLKTAKGIFKRPATKISILPLKAPLSDAEE